MDKSQKQHTHLNKTIQDEENELPNREGTPGEKHVSPATAGRSDTLHYDQPHAVLKQPHPDTTTKSTSTSAGYETLRAYVTDDKSTATETNASHKYDDVMVASVEHAHTVSPFKVTGTSTSNKVHPYCSVAISTPNLIPTQRNQSYGANPVPMQRNEAYGSMANIICAANTEDDANDYDDIV